MKKKPVSFEVIKESLKKRSGVLNPKNIRIVRRFTEYGKDYTEFLYEDLAYRMCPIPGEEYETCRAIYEDCWVVSKD